RGRNGVNGPDIAGAFADTPAAKRSGSGSEGRARAVSSKEPKDRSRGSEREVFHRGPPMSSIALLHIKIWTAPPSLMKRHQFPWACDRSSHTSGSRLLRLR